MAKEHCIAMVQCKVLKQLSILEQKRSDDEDIMNDVEFLNERLQASVQDLSSFDQYATEIKSGRLVYFYSPAIMLFPMDGKSFPKYNLL